MPHNLSIQKHPTHPSSSLNVEQCLSSQAMWEVTPGLAFSTTGLS